MAFPWISEATFDDGTKGHFDTETDTESILDFPHYSTLAALPVSVFGPLAPYRGAYCVRVNLVNDGSPVTGHLQETGSWDLAADGTIHIRFAFFLSKNTVMADTDEFAILQLWSSTNTVEAGVYINYTTANGFRVGIGETAATQLKPLTLGKWHIFEFAANIDAGGGNDGTLDGYLDGVAYTQITGLDQGAITSGVFGVMGQDAGTTAGTVLLDCITADDARIGYAPLERFARQRTITQSQHVFVGPGSIDAAALLSTTSGESMILYDTDEAEISSAQSFVLELAVGALQAAEGPIPFKRGCYAVLAGTAPRGQVLLSMGSTDLPGGHGPLYYSEAGVRMWGLKRNPRRA